MSDTAVWTVTQAALKSWLVCAYLALGLAMAGGFFNGRGEVSLCELVMLENGNFEVRQVCLNETLLGGRAGIAGKPLESVP